MDVHSQSAEPRGGTGRRFLWAGVGLAVLAIALAPLQLSLKLLGTPWQVPALTTLGAGLLVVAVARRRNVVRMAALVLIAALAGLEWYALAVATQLPAYAGPAKAGQRLPTFAATLADGRPFTEQDLQKGTGSVLTFFRGRW